MRLLARFCAAGALLIGAGSARADTMPQLDLHTPLTLSQVVWLAIIFAVLYGLMSRWALPLVGAVLEQRAGIVAADLETARGAKRQADEAVAELTQASREASATANARLTEAADRAKAAAAKDAAAQQATLDAQLALAEQRIAAARASAVGALRQVATETAEAVVTRLTGKAAEPDRLQEAVDAAMAARGA
jgi:F-type H+-transporting ATPase subunit b